LISTNNPLLIGNTNIHDIDILGFVITTDSVNDSYLIKAIEQHSIYNCCLGSCKNKDLCDVI